MGIATSLELGCRVSKEADGEAMGETRSSQRCWTRQWWDIGGGKTAALGKSFEDDGDGIRWAGLMVIEFWMVL